MRFDYHTIVVDFGVPTIPAPADACQPCTGRNLHDRAASAASLRGADRLVPGARSGSRDADLEGADAVDLGTQPVPLLERHLEIGVIRVAGGNQVTRLERAHPRQIADQLGYAVEHGLSPRELPLLAIDQQPHRERLRV